MEKAKVVFLMADYGNDPTEVATPFTVFQQAGYDISFATEHGTAPKCDSRMLEGWTQKLLGAAKPAIQQYNQMLESAAIQSPLAWSSDSFSLESFDLIFLPGGHDKGMQQIITSKSLHSQLARYMPLTRTDSPRKKVAAAICHGVQILAAANSVDDPNKSVLHDLETTSLTKSMESGIFWATRLFLGDYYKTFGSGTDNVETAVRAACNYMLSKWTPDSRLIAERIGEEAFEQPNETIQE